MTNNPITQMSDIMEFVQVNEFLEDEAVERSLLKLASVLAKPEINPVHVARHVVECDALATTFAIKAKYYMTIGKDTPDSSIKKNFYMTLREEMHALANSLKIMVRAQT